MQLSPDQDLARKAILSALSGGQTVSVLVGPAGSGKTTLLRALLADITREVALLCPTGKAAARLSEVTGRRANTIHRALYGRVKEVSGDRGRTRLVFDGKQAPCPPGGLVVCDEASMVGERLHRDLLDHLPTGAQLLYVGDREQLPPVEGAWGPDFTTPTAVLETIHRQAESSPILSLATAIREGRKWDGWVEGVCQRGPGDPVAWLCDRIDKDATLITTTNNVRRSLNTDIRERLGHTGPLVPGERIVCLRNSVEVGLMNGEVRTIVTAAKAPGPSWLQRVELWDCTLDSGESIMINVDLIGQPVSAYTAWKKKRKGSGMDRLIHADYGYCLTVHKSQGSQWSEVGFVACPAFRRMSDRRRLAYTAVTRASEKLRIF
ncbi:MAG: ATP-dependent exoDNAse (exonuclease V) alpha subunit [Myxococcota bacterium]|jgi:ATP-dependent exoDNAse (exonuclease V) alpha subunit